MINNKIKIFLSIIALAFVSSVLASADSYATRYSYGKVRIQPWDCQDGGTVTGVTCNETDDTLRINDYDAGTPFTVYSLSNSISDYSSVNDLSTRTNVSDSPSLLWRDTAQDLQDSCRLSLGYSNNRNAFWCYITPDLKSYYIAGQTVNYNSLSLPFVITPPVDTNEIVGSTTYYANGIKSFTGFSLFPNGLPNTPYKTVGDKSYLDFSNYQSLKWEVSFASIGGTFSSNNNVTLNVCYETAGGSDYCFPMTKDDNESTGNYILFKGGEISGVHLSNTIKSIYLETSNYYSFNNLSFFRNIQDGTVIQLNSIDLITDNDDTYSPDDPVNGTVYDPNPPYDPDDPEISEWYDSLVNLFSFEVINPFYGIYALFTGSDSCVSIPILAGMLNSTSTTYCPWFSSSTRAVLTPVFGIAGVMVLFGFFVSWLKGSAGSDTLDLANPENGNSIVRKKK